MARTIDCGFLLASVATLAMGAPAVIQGRSDFSVNQVQASQISNSTMMATDLVMQTYYKYGWAGAVAPAELANPQAPGTGSVLATPLQFDSLYLSPISAGGQTLMLDFDTGSSDLWVFSSQIPASQSSGHSIYNPTRSSNAALQNGLTWAIGYADGSGAKGIVYKDTVVVGGATATRQAVEAATSVSASFAQNKQVDGLFGLAFSSLNTVRPTKQLTFFDNVKPSLRQKLFAADLRHSAPGAYDFGFINTARITSPVTYSPVDTSMNLWAFTATRWSVGAGTPVSGSVGPAIADTGTSLLYLPRNVVQAYYAQVPRARTSRGLYLFPCNSRLPDFNTAIGGTVFTIPGRYINYAPAGTGLLGTPFCLGGIQDSTGFPFSVYGDIFLKAVYAVFDQTQGAPRLGFAKKNLT